MEGRSTEVNVLLSRMAKMADHSRENEMVHRIQDNTILYCMLCYAASKSARRLYIKYGSLATKTTNTNGVKKADSTL